MAPQWHCYLVADPEGWSTIGCECFQLESPLLNQQQSMQIRRKVLGFHRRSGARCCCNLTPCFPYIAAIWECTHYSPLMVACCPSCMDSSMSSRLLSFQSCMEFCSSIVCGNSFAAFSCHFKAAGMSLPLLQSNSTKFLRMSGPKPLMGAPTNDDTAQPCRNNYISLVGYHVFFWAGIYLWTKADGCRSSCGLLYQPL